MTVKIITDSSADLNVNQVSGISYTSVPLKLQIDDQNWIDNDQLDLPSFLQALRNTHQRAISSCPSLADWLAAFAGCDEIYVVTITGALSGSYTGACQAAEIFQEEHPATKIHVFDSQSASGELQLIIAKISQLVTTGVPFEKVITQITAYQQQTHLLFALHDLTNLANNGRVKPTVAKLAKLLNLYMIGTAHNGQLELLTKVRSSKRCYQALLKEMIQQGYRGGKVLINHVQALAAAKQLAKIIQEKFPQATIKSGPCRGLCSFYAESGGLMVAFEI